MPTELMRIFANGDKFGPSDREEVNFYFESGKLAVSDNHRMAYWFFIRQKGNRARLIHMDSHLDCEYLSNERMIALGHIDPSASLDAFVGHKYSDRRFSKPVSSVNYGNWIPALVHTHRHMIAKVFLICRKGLGTIAEDLPIAEVATEEAFWAVNRRGCDNTYYSIDVDHYFDQCNGHPVRPEYGDPCDHFRKCLQHALVQTSAPTFVALSPQCCGGWQRVMPFVHAIDQVAGTSLAAQVEARIT